MQMSDFGSPTFYADPYPTYAALRSAGPLVAAGPGMWITGHYAIVEEVLRDRRFGKSFMELIRKRYGEARAQGPVFRLYETMMLVTNPPAHTRVRSLLLKAFNANQMPEFCRRLESAANQLLDRIEQGHAADLVSDYALQLPLAMICSLLDMPLADGVRVNKAVESVIKVLDVAPLNDEAIDVANAAATALESYFRDVFVDRRARPGTDQVSLMLSASDEGQQLTEREIVANIVLLFIAGYETTANMIGNSLIALHRCPDQLAQLKADMALLPATVAESLRFDGSVQMTRRTALEDAEIAGISIVRGDTVFVSMGAANRDSQKFTRPDRFDIGRLDRDPRPLTFGGGIHYCLGARLAVAEIEIGLGTLIRRIPDLKITNLQNLRWHPRDNLRGVESLMAAW
jgi:cytochrome P450